MPGALLRTTLLLTRLAGAGLLAAVALSASAAEPPRPADPLYHVELLFLKPVTVLGVPEDWTVEAARAQPDTVADADADQEETGEEESTERRRLAVRTLSAAQFRLAALEATLQRSHEYELLRHVGWIQAATPRGDGLTVDIGDVANDGQPLHGTVALERGRYLHLRLNLTYTPEAPPNSLLGATSAGTAAATTFALKQQRRVRPFERHYFDHPAFGVIAMVSPVGATPR